MGNIGIGKELALAQPFAPDLREVRSNSKISLRSAGQQRRPKCSCRPRNPGSLGRTIGGQVIESRKTEGRPVPHNELGTQSA